MCSSYSTIVKAVDQLLPAKLAFMLSICEKLLLLSAEFQTDKPMVSFLSPAINSIKWLQLARILKKEVLDAAEMSSKLAWKNPRTVYL